MGQQEEADNSWLCPKSLEPLPPAWLGSCSFTCWHHVYPFPHPTAGELELDYF